LTVDIWIWLALVAFIGVLLVLDLFVFHREAHEVSFREATLFSAFWIAIGVGFGMVILLWQGGEKGGEYFAGYLIEKALSVDNVFVFAMLFAYFAVPPKYQHRVLFWGVIGALAMRGIFILLGAELLETYDWIVYLFGALLIGTGLRMLTHKHEDVHPERNPIMRFIRRRVPIVSDYRFGQRLWVRRDEVEQAGVKIDRKPLLGVWVATPLFAVLVAVETTDVIFAVDSVPAIFAITTDTFIVFSANAFALIGLRALYFMLAASIQRFVYLKYGLSLILVFVGGKFIWGEVFGKVGVGISLPFIALVVTVSILASLWATRERSDAGRSIDGGRSGDPDPGSESTVEPMLLPVGAADPSSHDDSRTEERT
jgi:tellurite resistance protein TerC